ncbi:hypothetical protein D3C79_1039980 [compost metagenome]
MDMLGMCASQAVMERPSSGAWPDSSRRLASYRPMARKGPSSRQPLASDITYSGRERNSQAMSSAIPQKQAP